MSESTDPAGQDAAEAPTDALGLPQVRDRAHDDPEAAKVLPPPDRDLEDLLRRRVPQRTRIAQGLLLLLAIAVVTGLLIRGVALTPRRAQVGVATATPVPLGSVLLLSNVSAGTLTLNGTPLAGPPPFVATFRRGLNTLTLSAPPFLPRTCHVRWPGGQVDGGCTVQSSIGPGPHYLVNGRVVSPVLIVALPFGPDDLPSAERAGALAAATAGLQQGAPRTRVPAGEYVATGQDADGAITSRRTATPLDAALLASATSLRDDGVEGLFCGDPGCAPGVASGVVGGGTSGAVGAGTPAPATQGGQLAWVVTLSATIRWQFGPPGAAVAASAPWTTDLPPALLTYDAQRGWALDASGTARLDGYGLALALAQTTCTTLINYLYTAATAHGDTLLPATYGNPLQGCVFALRSAQGTDAGRFLWRFSVLLAADGPAHALLPSLPLASASTLAAVGA